MNIPEIKNAIIEADRFLDRAKDALKTVQRHDYTDGSGYWERLGSPKESGALRRASMDLTRALADMRRP